MWSRGTPKAGSRAGAGLTAYVKRSGQALARPRRPRSSSASAVGVGDLAVLVTLGAGHGLVEVDDVAGGVLDGTFSSTDASALRRATSATMAGIWPSWSSDWANGSGPCRTAGVHDEELDELLLLDLHLLLLGDRVEQELGLEALAGALVDLGAVLVVLEATLALEVAVHLGLDDALGDRHLDLVEDGLEELVARGDALRELGVDLGLGGEVGLELLERVELRGELGELVVELGQLALLDRGDGDGAVGLLALAVATGERGGEGLRLVGRHADEGLVETLEHVLAADLVGDAGDLVDLLAVDLGRQVDGDEVAVLDRPVDALERAEAGAQGVEALLHVLVGDRGLVDGQLDVGEVGQLDLGTTCRPRR